MSNRGQFTAARADRPPKGHGRALKAARYECRECWVVGGHDPLCSKTATAANARAHKTGATP
jgi:hypothetical protein